MPVRLNRVLPLSLWLIFFVNGAVLSCWAPRIPEVKHALALTDSELGTALLGIAAGSVPALLLTARLLKDLRPGPVSVVAALGFVASLPLVGQARSLLELTAALVLIGAVGGALDVAMNTAGIAYQQQRGTRVLSKLHGGYSLGALAGASSGIVATTAQASVTEHFVLMAIALLTLSIVAAPALWRQRVNQRATEFTHTRNSAGPDQPGGQAMLPATIAVLAVSGLLIEGLVTDWSALLITREFGAPTSWGAAALTAFSVAMFISRSAGDALTARLGEERLLTVSAATIVAFAVTSVTTSHPMLVLIAITVMGLMLGPIFPLAVARAGRTLPGQEAMMTARVSVVGYLAYLAGPPGIGMIADHLTLPTTFALVVVLACAGITVSGRQSNPV